MADSNKWAGIETAPKDGTAFLAYCVELGGYRGEICAISWDAKAAETGKIPWRVNGVEDRLYWLKPMKWMPLPEPPK